MFSGPNIIHNSESIRCFFPGTHDTNIPWRNVTLVCFRGSIIVNMSEETGSRCYPLNQKCDIHLPCPRNISFSCYGEYINKILLNLHAQYTSVHPYFNNFDRPFTFIFSLLGLTITYGFVKMK